jgi:hypothetical protein
MRKIYALLAAFMLALGWLATPAAADPIKEQAIINGCDPNNVCLYDWTNNNYASGFWQRSYTQFRNAQESGIDCINLPDKFWHDLNGSPNNTASSLIINWGNATASKVTFYDATGCGVNGGYYYGYNIAPNGTIIETNMAVTDRPGCLRGQCSLNYYDRISSIQVTPVF